MAIKNIKGLLTQATALPAAIEARLPEGVPKISTMLLDATGTIPVLPDFPMEIPDLPTVPEIPALPELPGFPGANAGLGRQRRYVTGVEVREAPAPVRGVIPLVSAGERLPQNFITVNGQRVPVSVT